MNANKIRDELPADVKLAFAFAKQVDKRGARTNPEEALLVLARAYAKELAKSIKPEKRVYTLKDFL